MKDIPIDIALTPQLEGLVDLGGEITSGGFFAWVGDEPIPIHVRSIFKEFNQAPESKIYERFDVWMIPHNVSIMRRDGNAEPTAVGIEVEYLNGDRTCSIISLFPSFQWRQHGGGELQTKISCSLSPTGELSKLAEPIQEPGKTASFMGLKCGLSAKGQVYLDLSANVATPFIHASGVGARRCEWRFDRDKEPLFGRNIDAWSVIVLPKYQEEIRFRMRYYFNTRTLFFTTRRESEWVEIVCKLVKPEDATTES